MQIKEGGEQELAIDTGTHVSTLFASVAAMFSLSNYVLLYSKISSENQFQMAQHSQHERVRCISIVVQCNTAQMKEKNIFYKTSKKDV